MDDAEIPLRELIAFQVGAQEFCIEIMAVRELRGWTPATPLPHAPPYVCGVINLRGIVLPVIDTGRRLGLGACEPGPRHVIIVANVEQRLVGLLVDGVSDILKVADEDLQPTPAAAGEALRAFVTALLDVEGRMIGLLDLGRLLFTAQAEAA